MPGPAAICTPNYALHDSGHASFVGNGNRSMPSPKALRAILMLSSHSGSDAHHHHQVLRNKPGVCGGVIHFDGNDERSQWKGDSEREMYTFYKTHRICVWYVDILNSICKATEVH